MIIYTVSPRRAKYKEVASGPLGGNYNVIRYKDDLSEMVATCGTLAVKITRADYETIKDIFEKYTVKQGT